ncbi:MAG: hypothetical protein FWG65_06670 [Turicibacter sp.]|nr:hypothetical protein [Turicibacter sp.]
MDTLLLAREMIIKFYKQFEPIFLTIIQFLFGVYVFTMINGIGYMRPELVGYYYLFPVTVLFGIVFVIMPLSISYLIMIVAIAMQYSANLEVAAVIFVFLLCMLTFYARMAARESILILLTFLAFGMGVPYLIPLVAGMYFSITAIIPVAIGVFIAAFAPNIETILYTTQTADLNLTEVPDVFGDVYLAFTVALNNSSHWVFIAFIFAVVIIFVHVVSKLAMPFAKEIAIGLGCGLTIFSYFLASAIVGLNVNMALVMISTLFSGILMLIARIFDPILDYQRAESVRFQDDENYYYVRVVPKIQLSSNSKPKTRSKVEIDDEEDEVD